MTMVVAVFFVLVMMSMFVFMFVALVMVTMFVFVLTFFMVLMLVLGGWTIIISYSGLSTFSILRAGTFFSCAVSGYIYFIM